MRKTHSFFFIAICVFIVIPARAACTPCNVTYTLQVRYKLGLVQQSAIFSGTAQVSDGALDLDAGPVQSLLASKVNPSAVLIDVTQVKLNASAGAAFAQNDTLLASDGGVIAWVDAPNGPSGHLHFTTAVTNGQAHPFTYVYSARGTESPQVTFNYTMTASGNETYAAAAHTQQDISIAYYLPGVTSGAECRHIEGTVCLPVGSKRTSKQLTETGNGSSTKIDNTFTDSGDRCAYYRIEVSSTNLAKKMCNGSTAYNCSHCGAWYSGRVTLDGTTETQRAWSRAINGTGQAEGKPASSATINYAAAGGQLGSGLPGFIALTGSTSYAVTLSNCKSGSTPIACSNLGTSISGNVLTVSTVYAQPASTSKPGSNTLKNTDGTKSIDSLVFTTENNDVRHYADVTFQNTTYKDLNNDGYVDAGPFSLWSTGANGDQLVGAFDRTGYPTAIIDSITPNPALLGQTVLINGHGSGLFTTYQWMTHRLDQPGGQLLGITANIAPNNLAAGAHQIRFQVSGTKTSPFAYANLVVNQPPVAFINHIENVNDLTHPSVSLLLHDGAQTDPFSFDGGGVDFDGAITAFEWSSDIEPGNVIGTAAQFSKPLTALGTHTISYRVRDNAGAWSAAVKQKVTVRRPPVLLVHGICGDVGSWDVLSNNGWLGPQWQTADIVRKTFDANGDGITNDSPADNAQVVYQTIQQMKQTYGVRTVDLVVHSMGGLDSRAYIEGPAYQGDVNKLVMLSTPNHGSSIADLALITNGYSQQDVQLYIPIPGVQGLLQTLGVVVDIVDWLNPASTVACLGQDSPGLHALRPHSDFLRNLNHTYKDEGTEDFGASNQPNDYVPNGVQYFVIHGARANVSHTHLPNNLVTAIRLATGVNLAQTSLLWARDGDGVVTNQSARLDNVPSDHFDHGHMQMQKQSDSVGKALFYLLDDPPQAERDSTNPAAIAGAHLLGAGRATILPAQSPAPVTLNVDGAARRLRVSVSWGSAEPTSTPIETRRIGVAPSLLVVLTSPAGVIYSSDAGRGGFAVTVGNGNVDVAIDSPQAGAWKLEVRTPATIIVGRAGLQYTWLAFEESGAFVALGVSADNVKPGEPVTIAAYVQNNGAGVSGANVKAAVSSGKEKPIPLPFTADARYPGLYVATFTPPASGTFRILSAATIPASPAVTRFAFINIESRLLPDLTISLTGTASNLTAKAENRGPAAATKIPVRFFDGAPAENGRLLGERILTFSPASTINISIPWSAKPGAHRLFAIIDPSNVSGETNTTDNVAKLTIETRDTTPPVARAGADQTATVGQQLVLDGRASTDDDRIMTYRWAVLSDIPTRRLDITGGYVMFPAFAVEGTYTIRLTVTDPSGNNNFDDLVVRVVKDFDKERPVANAGADLRNVQPGTSVKLNGLGSTDNYGIAYAAWDVDIERDSDGDGNPANDQDLVGLAPTLIGGYAKPGNYIARLTVRDAVGNGPSTDNVQVSVGMVIDPGGPIPGGGPTPTTN